MKILNFLCFLLVFWSVHPHSSHHDCCQKENGGDASTAQGQRNQVSSCFYCAAKLIQKTKTFRSNLIFPFFPSVRRWIQTPGLHIFVKLRTACISEWPSWPPYLANKSIFQLFVAQRVKV